MNYKERPFEKSGGFSSVSKEQGARSSDKKGSAAGNRWTVTD